MTLAQDILALASKGPAGLEEADRLALLQASEKLTQALETPMDKFLRHFFAIYDPIVIILAVDLNLVDIAVANNGPITAAELAEKSKADLRLINRILKMLVPEVFTSTADTPQRYTPTAFGRAIAKGAPLRSAIIHFHYHFRSAVKFPDYFAANGYKHPVDARDSPFCFSYGCKGETYFDFMNKPENVKMFDAFNETMTLVKPGEHNKFVQSYSVKERLAITEPSRPLFVDVGGGVGHQVVKFCERAEGLPGVRMLLDLPSVIAQAKGLPDGVVTVGHSFFDPFPPVVKGAKAFYLRMLLHDWPEMQALTILTNIVNSMAEDSVVLIHEVILPETETEVVHFDAKMDWQMMNLGSSERTEAQWKDLFGKAGLEIRGLWWEEEGTKGKKALMELGLKR
ncbi:hypothetical protein J4E83_005546 [Alternaria metachromatica]|uniref:uncharacterized protein n=1 Tax=Alternaria metachromatica TaxID=283354 RepID=UPI0020C3B59C|nr:uncharacterized protein J4E83_005546 [Alternaria metachromatica]KAI4619691.1 hypothetical protein J4E83_005546 [Alternaria metachromatica]